MSEFEDFIKSGEVKIKEKNNKLADALTNSSGKGESHAKKQELNEENAEFIVADVYDAIREIIEAKLALEGYKSYSHEATVPFLKKFKEFGELEVAFLDNLRKIRHGIKYYGKESGIDEAKKSLEFLDAILPKLKNLLKNEK